MTAEEQLEAILEANRVFADTFDGERSVSAGASPARAHVHRRQVGPGQVPGAAIGDAHVLRNAGGRVTDDVVRRPHLELAAGTGVPRDQPHGLWDDHVHERRPARIVGDATGVDVSQDDYLPFTDVERTVREDVTRLRAVDSLPEDGGHGLIYDVRTGSFAGSADRGRRRPSGPTPP